MVTDRHGDPITAEIVRAALDYDASTGLFTWRHRADVPNKWNGKWAGKLAGHKCATRATQRHAARGGYVFIEINGSRPIQAHRLAWLYVHGEWPQGVLDHINGNRSDNRLANLRSATWAENAAHKIKQRNNRSGCPGVWFSTQAQKWEAQVVFRGYRRFRARFDTFEEAVAARTEAVKRIHGEFAKLNH